MYFWLYHGTNKSLEFKVVDFCFDLLTEAHTINDHVTIEFSKLLPNELCDKVKAAIDLPKPLAKQPVIRNR